MDKQFLSGSRRDFLAGASGAALAATGCKRKPVAPEKPAGATLELKDFQPRSMLAVPETKIERAKFPVIDVHTHVYMYPTVAGKDSGANPVQISKEQLDQIVKWMDQVNIQLMVNSTGGSGDNLKKTIADLPASYPGRFLVLTEPAWGRVAEPGYAKWQADEFARACEAGAVGIKILKDLGLYLREKITEGPLIKIDDPRFDPMWEAAGALKLPVAIHTSDPRAFFLPIDRFNERYEELNAHPDWSFHGRDYPSNMELQQARLRVIARHPRTQFVCLHVADSEDLGFVSECMDKHPNMLVEIGARIGELGRQPRAARKFFDRYQDRIMFGTDAVPHGDEYPQQVFGDLLYQIYYRFLETEDEYFDYAPAPKPPQGRWRIYGLGLPETILRKVYYQNAERLLGLKIGA